MQEMCRASIPFYKTNIKKVYRQYRVRDICAIGGEHGCLYNMLVHLQYDTNVEYIVHVVQRNTLV